MLEVTELDFWRITVGRLSVERITNEQIREIMQVTHTKADELKNRQLT